MMRAIVYTGAVVAVAVQGLAWLVLGAMVLLYYHTGSVT